MKNEILSLKSKIKELYKRNEELNIQNSNYTKIINEEPDEESIKKEVELLSQIRTLKFNNQMLESSLKEEKALNEALNKKISKLELDYNQTSVKNNETISTLEKKIEDLESKLVLNPNNNFYNTKESLQFYLSLFNENVEQFIQLTNSQINKNNDYNDKCLENINNIVQKLEENFNKKIEEFILKINKDNSNAYENEINIEKNINWLKKEIDELLPYKEKCLMLNKEINKLQIDIDMFKEKEELNKLRNKNIKNKFINKFTEFVKSNLSDSDKLDEFDSMIKNLESED